MFTCKEGIEVVEDLLLNFFVGCMVHRYFSLP